MADADKPPSCPIFTCFADISSLSPFKFSKALGKPISKKVSKASNNYKITKPNNNIIFRDTLSDLEIAAYKAKGCKVEAK